MSLLTSFVNAPNHLSLITIDASGHIGVGGGNPTNALIRVGAGTGSLTDKPVMGLKAKIDSTAATTPDGIQSNVNIVSGAAGNGSIRALLGRVDVNDAASTGDVIAAWGDVLVNVASARNVWAANFYTQINSGASYTGAAIGAEIGIDNRDAGVANGVILHLTTLANAIAAIRAGLKIDSTAAGGTIDNHIILDSGTVPNTNFIYIGPTTANQPSGTALWRLDKAGKAYGPDGSAANPTWAFLNSTNMGLYRIGAGNLGITTAATRRFDIDAVGNVAVWNGTSGAIAASATDGFLYINTVAGTPSGVPTTKTGCVAMRYDTTAHKLWIYDAGWKGVVVA